MDQSNNLENDLFEHYQFKADKGQEPLRVDKFLMNRIENSTRNKIQTAAKNGASGISDYLETLNSKLGLEVGSTFRDPIQLSKQEEQEFFNNVKNIDYNKDDYSEDRALKKYFQDWYKKKDTGPGEDKMLNKLKSHRREKERAAERNKKVLDDISDDLYDPLFLEKLKHSTPAEIDQRVQNFLA